MAFIEPEATGTRATGTEAAVRRHIETVTRELEQVIQRRKDDLSLSAHASEAGGASPWLTALPTWESPCRVTTIALQEWLDVQMGPEGNKDLQVLPAVDWRRLPPGTSLDGWLMQQFYPLVQAFHVFGEEDGIREQWTRAFRAGIMGYMPGQARLSAFDRLSEEEERLAHAQDYPKDWAGFCDRLIGLIESGRKKNKKDVYIVVPILRVVRTEALMQPLFDALDRLYHPRLIWIIGS